MESKVVGAREEGGGRAEELGGCIAMRSKAFSLNTCSYLVHTMGDSISSTYKGLMTQSSGKYKLKGP